MSVSNVNAIACIDHLVYFVPSLEDGQDLLERELGVRPVFGGQHVGLGTHNALLSLGDSYLELIAPDPEQPDPAGPRPFGIDDLTEPSLITFAVRPLGAHTMADLIAASIAAGHDPGEPLAMSRLRPDGVELQWTLTFPTGGAGGALPFFIDWGETPNPATSGETGIELIDLRRGDDATGRAGPLLDGLGIDVGILDLGVLEPGSTGLAATIASPSHSFVLNTAA